MNTGQKLAVSLMMVALVVLQIHVLQSRADTLGVRRELASTLIRVKTLESMAESATNDAVLIDEYRMEIRALHCKVDLLANITRMGGWQSPAVRDGLSQCNLMRRKGK